MKTITILALILLCATSAFAEGSIKIYGDLEFSDTTKQSTATVQGPVGLQGVQGDIGPPGPKGDKGDNSTVTLVTICNAIGALNAVLPTFCDAVGITSIAISPINFSIAYGTSQQFTATATYADGSTAPLITGVAWSSLNVCSLSGLNAYVPVTYVSVLLGDASPLSPSAKVIEARTQFNSLYALARVGNVDAVSKLQSLSNIFLTISRAYYASSSPYFSDFSTVTAALVDTTSLETRDMTAANTNACGIGSLRAFKNSLMISTLAGLSPESKYTKARAQFDDIFMRAKLGDTEANWQFNTVANAFLSASSAYNASGPAYVADFNIVQQAQTQIQALVLPSSPASIASVSGLASGVAIGRSMITATSKGKSATTALTITSP